MADEEREGTDSPTRRADLPRWAVTGAFAVILSAQVFLAFLGISDQWVRGHNGWNNGSYQLSARNTIRWGVLFPVQRYTGTTPPTTDMFYTHHPLAMHLTNTASMLLFGDNETAIRLVPAVHGILALLALLLFVRRFWDDLTAIVAGAVYVALPINGIYINMMNHQSGFIIWILAFLACTLSFHEARAAGRPWVRWYLGLMGAFVLAGSWDWPAYYVAFATAIHWFVAGIIRHVRSGRPLWKPGADMLTLAGFCALVLALFVGHFLLVHGVVGSFQDLKATFGDRVELAWASYLWHLGVAPRLLFTLPVLAIGGVWLLALVPRLALGKCRARDLAPLVFAFAGILHFAVFRYSAFAHCYWGWTLMPFIAMVLAATVVWAGRLLHRAVTGLLCRWFRGRWVQAVGLVVGLASCLILVPLGMRSVKLVPEARRVGGSLWFIAKVRGDYILDYSSGRNELRFAAWVKKHTTRRTGVLIHNSFNDLVPERRFDTTLDREIMYVGGLPRVLPVRETLTDGWVFVGVAAAFRRERLLEFASANPYWQYGSLFMLDLRRTGADVRLYALEPRPMTPAWWYLVSPFEGPVEAVRMKDAEKDFLEAIAMRHKGRKR